MTGEYFNFILFPVNITERARLFMRIKSKKELPVWQAAEHLRKKINNESFLNELARTSEVDSIRTHVSENSGYLPSDNVYLTSSAKKVDGKIFYGFDCVILSKDASGEKISDSIAKSAQNSIGKLYGSIAKFKTQQTAQNVLVKNTLKQKILNTVKKFSVLLHYKGRLR